MEPNKYNRPTFETIQAEREARIALAEEFNRTIEALRRHEQEPAITLSDPPAIEIQQLAENRFNVRSIGHDDFPTDSRESAMNHALNLQMDHFQDDNQTRPIEYSEPKQEVGR